MESNRICHICKIEQPIEEFKLQISYTRVYKEYYRTRHCRKCQNIKNVNHRREQKNLLINYYSNGTNRCKCCDEHRTEFLSLDHINGGGNKERKLFSSISKYWVYLLNNKPEGIRVLCHNCNQSYGYYGHCPHQKEKLISDVFNI